MHYVCCVYVCVHTPVPVVVGSSLSSRDCSKLFSIPHRIRQCSSPTTGAPPLTNGVKQEGKLQLRVVYVESTSMRHGIWVLVSGARTLLKAI